MFIWMIPHFWCVGNRECSALYSYILYLQDNNLLWPEDWMYDTFQNVAGSDFAEDGGSYSCVNIGVYIGGAYDCILDVRGIQ